MNLGCINNTGGLCESIVIIKSGIISLFKSDFNAVSTANINAFPFACFNSLIFLSKDGPADTIIAGIFCIFSIL